MVDGALSESSLAGVEGWTLAEMPNTLGGSYPKQSFERLGTISNGGERGIRTLDTFPYTHFPGVRLRPLGHLSIALELDSRTVKYIPLSVVYKQ